MNTTKPSYQKTLQTKEKKDKQPTRRPMNVSEANDMLQKMKITSTEIVDESMKIENSISFRIHRREFKNQNPNKTIRVYRGYRSVQITREEFNGNLFNVDEMFDLEC